MSFSTLTRSGPWVTRGGWDVNKTYHIDDIVIWLGAEWQSLIPQNKGNEPDLSPSAWTELNVFQTPEIVGSGDNLSLFSATTAQMFQLSLGTASSPDTTVNPVMKVSRTIDLTTGQITGAGPDNCAAFAAYCKGTAANQVQPIGVLGTAIQLGTGDALGVQGISQQFAAGGGCAIGGFFNGITEAGASGNANGVQIDVENFTAEDLGRTNGASLTLFGWTKSTGTYNHITGPYTVGAIFQFGGGPGTGAQTAGCGVTAGSPTVTTAAAGSGSIIVGANVTGAGGNQGIFPPGNYIASVVPGVSFTMANILGNSPNANATNANVNLFFGGGPQSNYGLLFTNSNPVITSTFADFGNSLNSIAIEGAHTNAAMYVVNGGGPVLIGERTPSLTTTLLEVVTPNSIQSRPAALVSSPTSTLVAIRVGNSAGSGDFFAAGNTNNVFTGTAAGDTGIAPTTVFHIGGTKSIIKVTAANLLGFYNATAVAQPAAYTLNAGATSRNLPSGATLAQIEAFARQMAADISASNGGCGLVG